MSALAVKALVYQEQLEQHTRRSECRRCRRGVPCARREVLEVEVLRLRSLALMSRNVWATLPREAQDRIATEEGMAVLGMELVNGRRRKIRGWPETR
jgi:hypothetical protein